MQRGFVEDLWKQAFPVGTLCAEPHLLFQYNWNFSNLQDAFKEGGVLHGEEKVFVFGRVQPRLLRFSGQLKETYVPMLVAIVSPFPPSGKIAIRSLQTDSDEIIDMENASMGWVPYIPLEEHERDSSLERPLPQIYILSCLQREDASKFFEAYPNFDYWLPYVDNPYTVGETKLSTDVDIVYPGTIVCSRFNWKIDTPEEFANRLIYEGKLSRDLEDSFKGFVREKVEQGKRANREAIEEIEDLDKLRRTEERVARFEKMRFYKFYPVITQDTPNLSRARVIKSAYINRYYGKADQVF